jgi:hypothetical protein
MARRRALLLALAGALTAGLGRAAAGDDPAPGPAPADKPGRERNDPYPLEFRKRVDHAVDRGVEWLVRKQNPNGSWDARGVLSDQPLGVNALCTLACLKGGMKGSDPAMERAFGFMATLPLDRTYSVGTMLMALHARYAGNEDDPAISLKEGNGGAAPVPATEPCATSMSPADRARMKAGVEFLLKNRDEGHWGYPIAKGPLARYDLSNTQYAMLGLWAASRCGFTIPSEVWLEILDWALSYQERTGPSVKLLGNEVDGDYRVVWSEDARTRGFRYRPAPESPRQTGAMTTAGLTVLAICQDELWSSRRFTPDARMRTRKGIRDALAWLQENFTVTENPGEQRGAWHHYYLYGLERAGILSRSRFVGRYDWYLEGANHLLAHQDGAGSWTSSDQLTDTCFAVLFLRRSTQRAHNPAITPSDPVPAAEAGK